MTWAAADGGLAGAAETPRKHAKTPQLIEKQCVECGKPFKTNRKDKIRCSYDCQMVAAARWRRGKRKRSK